MVFAKQYKKIKKKTSSNVFFFLLLISNCIIMTETFDISSAANFAFFILVFLQPQPSEFFMFFPFFSSYFSLVWFFLHHLVSFFSFILFYFICSLCVYVSGWLLPFIGSVSFGLPSLAIYAMAKHERRLIANRDLYHSLFRHFSPSSFYVYWVYFQLVVIGRRRRHRHHLHRCCFSRYFFFLLLYFIPRQIEKSNSIYWKGLWKRSQKRVREIWNQQMKDIHEKKGERKIEK